MRLSSRPLRRVCYLKRLRRREKGYRDYCKAIIIAIISQMPHLRCSRHLVSIGVAAGLSPLGMNKRS